MLKYGLLYGRILCIAGFIAAGQAQAVNVNFSGTLVRPVPCVINGNQDIPVDFGTDLLTTSIDGSNYQQPLSYTIDCTAADANTLRLQFTGTGASFDPTVLATDKTGLGIRLKSGSGAGTNLNLNTWLNFTRPDTPVLQAVPVQQSGITLTAGAFTATTTLVADYQ